MKRIETVDVVAAVVQLADKVLLCQRKDSKRHGGLWEFPGGKVEAGESYADTLSRELKEELDVEVTSVGKLLFSADDEGSPFKINFIETAIEGELKLIEHQAFQWCSLDALPLIALAPADDYFVDQYLVNSEKASLRSR